MTPKIESNNPHMLALDDSEMTSFTDEIVRLQVSYCNKMQTYFNAYDALSDAQKGALPASIRDHMETILLVAESGRRCISEFINIPPDQRNIQKISQMMSSEAFQTYQTYMKFAMSESADMIRFCQSPAGKSFSNALEKSYEGRVLEKYGLEPISSLETQATQLISKINLTMEGANRKQASGLSKEENEKWDAVRENARQAAYEVNKEVRLDGLAATIYEKFMEKIKNNNILDPDLKNTVIALMDEIKNSSAYTEKQKYQRFDAISKVVDLASGVLNENSVYEKIMKEGAEKYPESAMRQQDQDLEQIKRLQARIPSGEFTKALDRSLQKTALKSVKMLRAVNELIETQQEGYIKNLRDYYAAYDKLRNMTPSPLSQQTALIAEHMESIRVLIETSDKWMNAYNPDPNKSVSENIQSLLSMLPDAEFRNHLAVYAVVKDQYEETLKFRATREGQAWSAAIDAELARQGNTQGVQNIEIMPVQRMMRFPLLLGSIIGFDGDEAKRLGIAPDNKLPVLKEQIEHETEKFNKNSFPGSDELGKIYRKISAELERAGVISDTFHAWASDLSNQCSKIDEQIAQLKNKCKKIDDDIDKIKKEFPNATEAQIKNIVGNAENDKLKLIEEVNVLAAKKEKIDEKFIKIEEKLDKELSKILKNNPPGSRRYADQVDSLVNKTICPMFSHLKLRILDNFKTRGLMVHTGTILNKYSLPEPEKMLSLKGIFGRKTPEQGTSVDVELEAGAREKADSRKNSDKNTAASAGENESNTNDVPRRSRPGM